MSKNGFRILVVLHQILDFSRDSIESATMPPSIHALVLAHVPKASHVPSAVSATLDWAMVVVGLAGLVGVLLFRSWGRWLYLLYLLLTLATLPIGADVIVSTRWSFLVLYICAVLWGVVATLLFTSPIKDYFRRPAPITTA